MLPNGALSGNEGEQVLRGSHALKAGYRHNIEPHVVLFEGIPEGTIFWAPLDQEFFYPSRSAAMADVARLASGQYLLDGSFFPRGIATPEGFVGGGLPMFGGCSSARSPRFPFCREVYYYAAVL